MDAGEWDEIVELDAQRFVALHFLRDWPRFVVEWSLKQRMGDSDFPVATGRFEKVPAEGDQAQEIWHGLRQAALQEAQKAAEDSPASAPEPTRSSWLSRLLGRD